MELIHISPELEFATHKTAQEICSELAVQLYAQGKLSAGKACELAGMTVSEFQLLLGSRGIAVNYGGEDFADDLDTIQRLKLDQ